MLESGNGRIKARNSFEKNVGLAYFPDLFTGSVDSSSDSSSDSYTSSEEEEDDEGLLAQEATVAVPLVDSDEQNVLSEDFRIRLTAYNGLITKCEQIETIPNHDYKSNLAERLQSSFRQNSSDKKISKIQIIFQDLAAQDRGMRLAAARLICSLAKGCESNQHLLLKQNGISFGFLRVFSLPNVFVEKYRSLCISGKHEPTQGGLIQFLLFLIENHHQTAMHTINTLLPTDDFAIPLCWSHPENDDESMVIPDPATHMIGFYLLPRKNISLATDEQVADKLLEPLNESDRLKLKELKKMFQKLSENGLVPETSLLKTMLANPVANTLITSSPIPLLLESKLTNNPSVSWSDFAMWCINTLNSMEMVNEFGAYLVKRLYDLFVEEHKKNGITGKGSKKNQWKFLKNRWIWGTEFGREIQESKKILCYVEPCGILKDLTSDTENHVSKYQGNSRTKIKASNGFGSPWTWGQFIAHFRFLNERLKNRSEDSCSTDKIFKMKFYRPPEPYLARNHRMKNIKYNSDDVRKNYQKKARLGVSKKIVRDQEDILFFQKCIESEQNDALKLEYFKKKEDAMESFNKNAAILSDINPILVPKVIEIDSIVNEKIRKQNEVKQKLDNVVKDNQKRLAQYYELRCKKLKEKEHSIEKRTEDWLCKLAANRQAKARENDLKQKKASSHRKLILKINNVKKREIDEQIRLDDEKSRIRDQTKKEESIAKLQQVLQSRNIVQNIVAKPKRKEDTARRNDALILKSSFPTRPPQSSRMRSLAYAEAIRSSNQNPSSAMLSRKVSLSRKPTLIADINTPAKANKFLMNLVSSKSRYNLPSAHHPDNEILDGGTIDNSERDYSKLDDKEKERFEERFPRKRMSKRLACVVQDQYCKISREKTVYDAFHSYLMNDNTIFSKKFKKGQSTNSKYNRIRRGDFVQVAQDANIQLSVKQLEEESKKIDDDHNGYIEWEEFYNWWLQAEFSEKT